jgi:hypothetical protein
MNDGPIDKKMKPKKSPGEKFMDLYQSKMGRKTKDGKLVKDY